MPASTRVQTPPPPAPADADSTRPHLLFFFASTSGKSRRAEGFLAQVLQRRRNHDAFRVRRIDVERHAQLTERFRVEAIPSLVVVDANRVRARLSSPRGCMEITEMLAPWLS